MGNEIDFAVSDPAELRALGDWFRGAPGARVERRVGVPGHGEQGALDYLTVIAGSTVLSTVIQLIPVFLKARRPGLTITTTVGGEDFTIRADNADEVLPVLERLLAARATTNGD